MTSPWTIERPVDSALALHLISSQFPDLKGSVLEPFGRGWDNVAYLVEERWVFRFPQRQIAVRLLEMEIACLPLIARSSPRVALPLPLWVGRPTPEYPWPFAGYPLVQGQTLERASLPDAERGELAVAVGAFLRDLHACPPPPEIGMDPCGRLDRERRIPDALGRLGALQGTGALSEHPAWAEILEASWTDAPSPVLLHGDLYCRHLVVSPNGRLSGIIDWGDLCLGSPMIDLCVALTAFDPRARARLLLAYGPVDPGYWPAAFFRALRFMVSPARSRSLWAGRSGAATTPRDE